jgi:RimJ/RimL family protein N-acetyltransferase
VIETERLTLRPWRDEDVADYVRVINTPAVMEHLGGLMELSAAEAACQRQQTLQAERGHSFWIVQRHDDGALLGFCGLKIAEVGPVAGDVEIGWRLREDAWGKGYAREAAAASIAWAWASLDAPRIISMTVPANSRSWGLMERLGLTRRADLDFGHPSFEAGHPLHQHIVYAVDRPE